MNSHPHPRKHITILHVTSCWLERLEIFIVIDSRTPHLVSCHASTGDLGRLSPYSMSVENRQKIQEAVDKLVSAAEAELPVHWCCAHGSVSELEDAIRHGAPLDGRHFAIGDASRIDPAAHAALREFTAHRALAQRKLPQPPVRVSRVRIMAA